MMTDQTGKIKIVIQRGAHVFNPSKALIQKITEDLSFKNPKYENAKKYGTFIGADVPAKLKFYAQNKEHNVLYIPRGYVFYLIRHLKSEGIPYTIEDNTTLKNQINLEFNGELRDYQESAIEGIVRYPGGILESGTGSGKTTVGLYMITLRKQPTLIIVHSKELLYQWQQRIKQFLGCDCGLIGDGKYVVKDITVGIIQSVKNKLEEIQHRFGHIIADECHRSPATTWVSVLDQLSAKYLLGLSATAYRNDGLDHVMNAFIGPKIHIVNKSKLHESGAVLKPNIYRIETGFYTFFETYTKLINDLLDDKKRNKLIVDTVVNDVKKYNNQILIVSDRVAHCHILQKELNKSGISSVVLSSNTAKSERQDIVESMRKNKYKVLISTVQLISEGFDLDTLDVLCLTSPIKYKGRLIQVVGRILRPRENKIPRIYDFRDDSVKMLQRMGSKRDIEYRKEKWVT